MVTLPTPPPLAGTGSAARDLHFFDALFERIETANTTWAPNLAVMLAPDYQALGLLLARLRKAAKELADCAMVIEDEMVGCVPDKNFEVPGVGPAEMHSGAKRTAWDKEGLMDILVPALAGELPPLLEVKEGGEYEAANATQIIRDVLAAYHSVFTPPAPKVTGLRSIGVDPKDFCETAWGRKTISMPALGAPSSEEVPE